MDRIQAFMATGDLCYVAKMLRSDQSVTLRNGTVVTAKELWMILMGERDMLGHFVAWLEVSKRMMPTERVRVAGFGDLNRLQLLLLQIHSDQSHNVSSRFPEIATLLETWTAGNVDNDDEIVVISADGRVFTRPLIRMLARSIRHEAATSNQFLLNLKNVNWFLNNFRNLRYAN